jgi:hypothetical protein
MRELIRHILHEHLTEQRESWTEEKLRELTFKYNTLTDFLKNERKAADALRRKGLYDEFTSHMDKVKTYSEEEIEQEARKYPNQAAFAKGSPNYYNAYKRRKLQDKFRNFLPLKNIRWTDEMLRDEAAKYNTIKDFVNNSGGAYKTAHDRGILDDITKHIPRTKIWTYDEVIDDAKKYKDFNEFTKNSPTFFQARSNGWLDDVKKFLPLRIIFWTKEMCQKEADKYTTKRDFKKNSPKAYSSAFTHGWLPDITKHMIVLGDKFKIMVYVFEFPDNHAYVGLTQDKQRRNYSHFDTVKITSPIAKHIVETGLQPEYKELSVYIDAKQAQELEDCTIQKYRQDGWIMLNKQKGGNLGACRTTFTKEMVQQIANKYTTRVDFKRQDTAAYQAAQKYGWLKDVVSHIPKQDRTVWTYDKVKELANTVNSRAQLKYKNQSAYQQARREGWLDMLFPITNK